MRKTSSMSGIIAPKLKQMKWSFRFFRRKTGHANPRWMGV
jgi:hypothetical protein